MIIELAKEYFWESPTAYQRWPELLVRFPDTIKSRSKNNIAIKYGNFLKDKKGRVHFDEFHNLFGAEKINNGYRIYGSNLIQKTDLGYVKSLEAKHIQNAYVNDSNWKIELLQQVLKYSLRSRALFSVLLDDALLNFPFGFLKRYKYATLKYGNRLYEPFSSDNERPNLNHLLWLNPGRTLGPFWKKHLGINDDTHITITGIHRKDPSLHSLDTWLRNPFYLASELGLIKEKAKNQFGINYVKWTEKVDSKITDSFGFAHTLDEISLLKDLIKAFEEFDGYFPVSIVGKALMHRLEPGSTIDPGDWTDRFIMQGNKDRRFQIIGYQQGQPRHGRGLLGNLEKQLIKLEF